jgi:uncharacterized protein (UPF0262 family)
VSDNRNRIVHIALAEPQRIRRRPEVEHERAVALFDILEENSFRCPEHPEAGPFRVHLAVAENRLILDIRDEADAELQKVQVALAPFKSIVRDYFLICESYYSAIKTASPSQIEAIDMGRRGLHNEGSEMLRERLAGKIDIDHDTARRLFTLICVLHIRG